MEQYGEPLHDRIAETYDALLKRKLPKSELDDLKAAYRPPSNAKLLSVPRVRPEIWNTINAKARTSDARSQVFQTKLSTALVAAAKIGNLAYSSKKNIDKEVRKELMEISLNVGKVLCAALNEISDN